MALKKNTPAKKENTPETSTSKGTPGTTTRLRKGKASAETPATASAETLAETPAETPASETVQEPNDEPAKTSVAKRPTATTPAKKSIGINSPFSALENNIPPGELEFGSIPRYTATNGIIQNSDTKVSIGKWAQFEPISFNDLFLMAPGSNDDESKEYLKFSYDGEMCTDGSMTMQTAIDEAKAAGYEKASIKKYVELFGVLMSAEKLGEDDLAIGQMVMFSCSPQSVKKWAGFKVQAAVQIKMGRLQPEDLMLVTTEVETRTFGSNTFSIFTFKL